MRSGYFMRDGAEPSKRIVEKGVGEMRRYFGAQPKDLIAPIGPGVHHCCYRVGPKSANNLKHSLLMQLICSARPRILTESTEKYPLLFLTSRARTQRASQENLP